MTNWHPVFLGINTALGDFGLRADRRPDALAKAWDRPPSRSLQSAQPPALLARGFAPGVTNGGTARDLSYSSIRETRIDIEFVDGRTPSDDRHHARTNPERSEHAGRAATAARGGVARRASGG
ncbi:MAG: hypothetical protein R3F54_18045 [Alphaproteobacteria bacterium]